MNSILIYSLVCKMQYQAINFINAYGTWVNWHYVTQESFYIRPPDVLLYPVCELFVLELNTCPKSKHFWSEGQITGTERCPSCSRNSPGWDLCGGGVTSLRGACDEGKCLVASAGTS